MTSTKATPSHIDSSRRVWETVVLLSYLSCHQSGWRGFRNSNPQHVDGCDKCHGKGGLTETSTSRGLPMAAGTRTKSRKGDRYGNRNNVHRDVACMMPQRSGCTSCRMRSGTALNRSVFCIPVRYMDGRLRRLKTHFFWGKVYEGCIT